MYRDWKIDFLLRHLSKQWTIYDISYAKGRVPGREKSFDFLPFAEQLYRTEATDHTIRARYTFLRPNAYMQVLVDLARVF